MLRPPGRPRKATGHIGRAPEGRRIVGVGAGWLLDEYDAVGIDPAERFARLDEHMAPMRGGMGGDGVSEHDGRFYRHQAAGFLNPVPSSPIPVLVGGSGDHTMRRVARWADGWAMPNVEPGPDAAEQLAELNGSFSARLRGRRPRPGDGARA